MSVIDSLRAAFESDITAPVLMEITLPKNLPVKSSWTNLRVKLWPSSVRLEFDRLVEKHGGIAKNGWFEPLYAFIIANSLCDINGQLLYEASDDASIETLKEKLKKGACRYTDAIWEAALVHHGYFKGKDAIEAKNSEKTEPSPT